MRREVYLTIEATRSAEYCRVVSSETVHCEGSSGSHPSARYRTNPHPSSHGPRRAVTRIPLQVTLTYAYIFISRYIFSVCTSLSTLRGADQLCVCACVSVHVCLCVRTRVSVAVIKWSRVPPIANAGTPLTC